MSGLLGQNPFAALGGATGAGGLNAAALAGLAQGRMLSKPRKVRGMIDEDNYLSMQLLMGQIQGQGVQINPTNGYLMYGDAMFEDGMFNLMNMNLAGNTA